MNAALQVDALFKTYRSFFGAAHPALRGLTLSVAPGVAFGLIGPNGAGKTTFIKVLLGIVQPTSGAVQVLGGNPQEAAIRGRIGYLPERMHLPSALRARDFLNSVATFKSFRMAAAEVTALLERVGLADSSQRIGTFSKGMRQRLGLAAAMLSKPEVLILDEPTDGIDPVGRTQVRALLLEEKKRGATILLNSHLLSETEKVCDRVGILEQGQLKLEGSIEDLAVDDNVWRMRFEGSVDVQIFTSLGLVPAGSEWTFVGTSLALNEVLDNARQTGPRLVSLAPQKKSLEVLLTETLDSKGEAP
jgi:ABC-2 type transport system ATP-binding protein